MWIFLSDSFLSIVQDKVNPRVLVVRARRPGDIEAVFPSAKVVTIDGRDYQFRTTLDREVVAQAMADEVRGIHHTNFKNSVSDHEYHQACSAVWGVMAKLQPIPPYGRAKKTKLPASGQRRLGFPV